MDVVFKVGKIWETICKILWCHSTLEGVFHGTDANLLRLALYFPMLSPIETIWSKINSFVTTNLRIFDVIAPGVGEQRLLYLERTINAAIESVVGGHCSRAVQHSTTFYEAVLNMADVVVGT